MKTINFKLLFLMLASACLITCTSPNKNTDSLSFLHVDGTNIVDENGAVFFIKGTNLGNWLNPEGYMFGFRHGNCNAPRTINDYFCQLVGPEEASTFWQAFKDNYITEEDIQFIASTGANTVRAPFHYKLFTDEDYLGLTAQQDGFVRLDTLVEWCRRAKLRVVLDMHDCPGGQTGDNIDDSYGYPWLFKSQAAQDKFCEIWKSIAAHYEDEPVILGYELMNEPIAHYFQNDLEELNNALCPLYLRCMEEIRSVDSRHIILLGGAQWNGNFRIFTSAILDSLEVISASNNTPNTKISGNYMWACHRYGHGANDDGIRDFIAFRDSTGIAMCMTETGHNSYEWYKEETETLNRNNISYLFWPYKKINESSWVTFSEPKNWQKIIDGANTDRSSFAKIRANILDYEIAHNALWQLIENVGFSNCKIDTTYIQSMGFSIGE